MLARCASRMPEFTLPAVIFSIALVGSAMVFIMLWFAMLAYRRRLMASPLEEKR
jgi:hypothetical protein